MNRMAAHGHAIGVILVLLFVSGCSGLPLAPTLTPATPTATPSSLADAEGIVRQYIAAWQSKDPEKYIALFADDGEIMFAPEPGSGYSGPQKVKDLAGTIRQNFASKEVKITSYFISSDGRYAAAEGTFTMDGKSGAAVTVPAAFILEFKAGKIYREILYYDGSPYY